METNKLPGDFFDEQREIVIKEGDTLTEIMHKERIPAANTRAIIASLTELFDPRDLKPGQVITLTLHRDERTGQMIPAELKIVTDAKREVVVHYDAASGYKASEIKKKLYPRFVRVDGVITSSLYEAASTKGLPLSILMQMIQAYSFDVDFQRDIQAGDSFGLLYENYTDSDGNFLLEGDLLFAVLVLSGKAYKIYRYTTADDDSEFYDETGQAVRKTLLRTPVSGAHLSSGFGMRHHPILGYSQMHRGLDFAAELGTPIIAAGNGYVDFVGVNGGYGKYIRIRHANEYSTAYGHLDSFARGMRAGRKVSQGQIIGFVGSTGVSTGPHLHYEVLFRSQPINPALVKFPPGRKLTLKELTDYLFVKAELEHIYNRLKLGTTVFSTTRNGIPGKLAETVFFSDFIRNDWN
ncbi:MAG: peptidoglycan DD-metalloendopeptidase family protein [Spirochaetota bacterium]